MDKPTKTKQGLTFFPIPVVSDASMAFGCDEKDYFPRSNRPDVPMKYERMVDDLFFKGGSLPTFQDGVDNKLAYRWVKAMLCSFAPPHECKTDTIAYAFWVWTEGDLS